MKLISHRGNLNGPDYYKENSPSYILAAINDGYDVETDIWYVNKEWFLGHDLPVYKIDFYEFICENEKLWLHAKNIESLHELSKMNNEFNINWLKYFWHQNDDFTLTSNDKIWTYIGKELTSESICVLPEKANYTIKMLENCYGICSDFITKYK